MPVPTSLELAAWLGCAVAVLVAVNQAMKFSRYFRETPRPLETYATKTEMSELKREITGRLDHLGSQLESLRCERESDKEAILKADEERTTKLHDRINEVLEAVSELRGKFMGNRDHRGGH